MRLAFIPLVTALLPAVGIHASYLLAALFGHVAWCFPYLDGCTSISATGRASPESHVFRATILPTAVFMMVYWRLSYEWLRRLGIGMAACNRVMLALGLASACGLIVYVAVLGSVGAEFGIVRRLGVTVFYSGTFIAQFLMTWQIAAAIKTAPGAISRRTWRGLAAICVAAAVIGLTTLALGAFYDRYDELDDGFEWVLTLLMQLHILITYFAWRQSGFSARFTVAGRRRK